MTLDAKLRFFAKTTESISLRKTSIIPLCLSKAKRRRTNKLRTCKLKSLVCERTMTARCNGCMLKCKWWNKRWRNCLKKTAHLVKIILLQFKTVVLVKTSNLSRDAQLLKSQKKRIQFSITILLLLVALSKIQMLTTGISVSDDTIRLVLKAWV